MSNTSEGFASTPIDSASAAAIADQGLRLGLVDTSDTPTFTAWLRADHRGFHGPEASDEMMAASLAGYADRRTTAVWDDAGRDAPTPVATVNSWPAPLTVPGAREVEAWAISSVTVAPTHRRRGIARALLEAELRTADALGIPLATLTVSESTIYGRFGFAPATFNTALTIATHRATWIGGAVPGSTHFIPVPEFRAELPAMQERLRSTGVGQIPSWSLRWDQLTGVVTDDKSRTAKLRAVAYQDAGGALRGLALFHLDGNDESFSTQTLSVDYLASETDDAYAALWRFLLEMDLVSTVKASDRPADEPLLWQVADIRAIKVEPYDHVWTRILDVPAALAARRYAADLETVIAVDDNLGFAAGTFALSISGGVATVTETDAPAALALRVNELSALYLGGVSAEVLVAAGRVEEREPGGAAGLDTAFRSARAPWLPFWF